MADITREELISRIQDKRKSFQNINLSGLDLRGIDLQRLDFTGASFVGARLSGNRLSESNCTRADFREVDLSRCLLEGTKLDHASLIKANLTDANLHGARAVKAVFRGADLSKAICTRGDFRGADFTRARLINTDFRNAGLEDAIFTEASMRGVLLRDAELTDVAPAGAAVSPAIQPLASGYVPRPMPRPSAPAPMVAMPLPGAAPAGQPPVVVPHDPMDWLPGQAAEGSIASTPKPPVRNIPAKIFTESGWITGQFALPVTKDFLEYLNRPGELLKLQAVKHPQLTQELSFFGLRADVATMVVPTCDEGHLWLAPPSGSSQVHRISFFMDRRILTGDLAVDAGVRISDDLNKDRWVVLRDCKVESMGASGGQGVTFPLLLLNTSTVIGISDESLENWD